MSDRSSEPAGESEASADGEDPAEAEGASLVTPAVDDASGIGLTMTLVTGVLLAFAYYGVRGVADVGFGRVIPPPFYLLGLALLFVVELVRSRAFDSRGLARVVGITAIFGGLIVLAVEGGTYLWERPEVALDDFSGAAVLAISLVVAALAYAGYLSATQSIEGSR